MRNSRSAQSARLYSARPRRSAGMVGTAARVNAARRLSQPGLRIAAVQQYRWLGV